MCPTMNHMPRKGSAAYGFVKTCLSVNEIEGCDHRSREQNSLNDDYWPAQL